MSVSFFRMTFLLLFGGVFIALAACTQQGSIEEFATVETAHPIELQQRPRSMVFTVNENIHTTIDNAAKHIDRFAREYRERGAGTLIVSFPDNAIPVVERIRVLFDRAGLPEGSVQYIAFPPTEVSLLSLAFNEYVAFTSPCGYFQEDLGGNFANSAAANFGCASQNNLAVSLVNPRDLFEHRPSDTTPSERARSFIERYRAGTIEEQSGVSISQ